YNIINYWLIRKERYKASSLNKVIRRTGESFTQISVGYFGKNIGLVIGDLLGNILNFLYGLILLINSKFPFNQIKIRLTIYAVKKYKQFPIYNLIPYLLEAVSYSIPIFAVNSIFSETEVGFLNLTRQVLIMPSVLIAIAISLVLYKKTTELYINKKSVKKELINIFKPLLVVIFFEIVILLLFGESLFKILFGNKWQLSGYISKILVFGFISSFIVNPFAVMLWVLNKLKIQAIWQIINFFIIGSLFFFKDLSFINFVKLYSVFLVISYLMYGIIIFRVINKYEQSLRNKM
ncbi:MAG: oligosaccharide flippase family protein, partial [bacterium]|nr:oligosaccharide flippase family protein [bacterium]